MGFCCCCFAKPKAAIEKLGVTIYVGLSIDSHVSNISETQAN